MEFSSHMLMFHVPGIADGGGNPNRTLRRSTMEFAHPRRRENRDLQPSTIIRSAFAWVCPRGVETPCTYISASAATSARSER